MNEITYDGRYVYLDIPDADECTLIDAGADLANYVKEKEIELIPRGAEVRDNADGTLTIRYGIRSIA